MTAKMPESGSALALELDVGRRHSRCLRPILLAVDDAAGDAVGPAEQRRRVLQFAGGERFAHGRTGDALALELDGVHGLDAEAMLLPGCLQHGEIAGAALAEAEVVADDQVPDAEAAHQDALDEFLGASRPPACG